MFRSLLATAVLPLVLIGCGEPSTASSATPPAASTEASPDSTYKPESEPSPKPSGLEKGSVGYKGTLKDLPHIPVCVNADDVASITRQDRDAMRDILVADTLFSADGGANVKIVDKKLSGLVKVEVLSGESTGRQGWVPAEMVE